MGGRGVAGRRGGAGAAVHPGGAVAHRGRRRERLLRRRGGGAGVAILGVVGLLRPAAGGEGDDGGEREKAAGRGHGPDSLRFGRDQGSRRCNARASSRWRTTWLRVLATRAGRSPLRATG